MIALKNRFALILLSVGVLLSIPFIAMQFTNEVNWSPFDFLIMGILLTGTITSCDFIVRRIKNSKHKILICGAIVVLFFLIWAELAVGIFGTPFAGS